MKLRQSPQAPKAAKRYFENKSCIPWLLCFVTYIARPKTHTMVISQKLSDFNTAANVAVPYIATNATRLKVDAGQVTDLGTFLTNWIALWILYVDPATHTSAVVGDLNTLYHLFNTYLENVKAQIKHNKFLALTSVDFEKIHIHVDADHRVHVPRSEVSPHNTDQSSTHLITHIFTYNPQLGHEKETHMQPDVKKISRKIAVVAAGVTPSDENYHALEPAGTTQYTLTFSTAQVGSYCWLITAYQNNRGEEGPESPPLSFLIV